MIAAVFPGQGAQKPGMGRELVEADSYAALVFDEISETLGRDLRAICWELDEDTLRQTDNAQIALFTCGIAAFAAFHQRAPGVHISAMAGHSVGEYVALVASERLSLADGARLVQRRGELMAASGKDRPGSMAAVMGLDRPVLEGLCREASEPDSLVVVANDNSPGQLVLSGDTAAVLRAKERAEQAGAKRVIVLNVSGAFHSPLMEPAALQMRSALDAAHWHPGKVPVYANVSAEPVEGTWPATLQAQLELPVRWTETVRHLRRDGITTFLEFGVGDVLAGLIRRTDKEAMVHPVRDPETLSAALGLLSGTL